MCSRFRTSSLSVCHTHARQASSTHPFWCITRFKADNCILPSKECSKSTDMGHEILPTSSSWPLLVTSREGAADRIVPSSVLLTAHPQTLFLASDLAAAGPRRTERVADAHETPPSRRGLIFAPLVWKSLSRVVAACIQSYHIHALGRDLLHRIFLLAWHLTPR